MKKIIKIAIVFLSILVVTSCSEELPPEPDPSSEPDNSPPTVVIVSPEDGSLVSDTENIMVQATDNVGVIKVEIYIDDNLYETLLTQPWQCEWDVTSYTHGSNWSLNAVAYDAAENKTTSDAINVEIYNPQSNVDTISPAAITDLMVSEATSNSLTLSWTAPGDDNTSGTADKYELKYSNSLITEDNYPEATNFYGVPEPQSAGQSESCTVTGLPANSTYYFAIKTTDDDDNISDLSNIATGNTEEGLFGDPVEYPIGGGNYPYAYSIVSADFDGDGDYDIAAAANTGVSVVFSDGTGVFGSPSNYNLGVSAHQIGSGDLDQDGDIDLVLAFTNSGEAGVTIMLNPGDGNFQESATYLTTSLPREICVADLNGDNNPDLALAHDNFVGGVQEIGADVLLNNGDATFQPVINYGGNTEGDPRSISAGDIDGDDDNDLVISCYDAKMVWVLWNIGNGIFEDAVNVLEGGMGDHSTAVLTADFNSDGFSDIAATNDYPDHINILLGSSSGTFELKGSYNVGGLPKAIALADYNGDGIADLATPGNNDGNASVILGNGDGSFQSCQYFYISGPLWDISTGDYDMDGDFDLAVLRGHRIFILLNSTIE